MTRTLHLSRGAAILMVLAISGMASRSWGKTIQVECPASGSGHSLEKALSDAEPGDVIRIGGVCTQKVSITTDRITLDGLGTAVFQGSGMAFQVFDALISVDGAQGVVIKGLRVENGPAEGITAHNGAGVILQNVTLRGSTIGLGIGTNSTVEVADCTIQNNFIGVDLSTGSSLVLKGKVVVGNNLRNGFDVTGNSTLEIRGAQVEASNNGGHGMTFDQSQLLLLGFPPSQGSSIAVSGNQGNGLLLGQSSLSLFGGPGANKFAAANNGANGIRALLGSRILSPQAAALFTITGNPVGIAFESDASALINGGLEVHNNGTGIIADGAGVLTIGPNPQVPSSITNNTVRDFDARFGSRIRLSGVPVGVIACDGTVLSQGLCP